MRKMKKILTVLTALTLTVSSAAAVSAANEGKVENKQSYVDVKKGDVCFDAAELLTRLGIMEGYGDKSFKPDKKVTRAEFSKLIINALGENYLKMAEDAKGHDTIFSDVKAEHWASGYITAAVSNSIINGMGDGTFAPEESITYEQAMKMLVCAVGYEQWSVDKGGWPAGYMYWGSQLKIGEGITDTTNISAVTRGQTAQMIKNALKAPLCVNTFEYTYDIFGNKYPNLAIKDGTGEEYKSMLIYSDIYPVTGYLSSDSVFVITDARNFNGEYYPGGSEKRIDINTSYAKDNFNKNAEAYIKVSENGAYSLIYMY